MLHYVLVLAPFPGHLREREKGLPLKTAWERGYTSTYCICERSKIIVYTCKPTRLHYIHPKIIFSGFYSKFQIPIINNSSNRITNLPYDDKASIKASIYKNLYYNNYYKHDKISIIKYELEVSFKYTSYCIGVD